MENKNLDKLYLKLPAIKLPNSKIHEKQKDIADRRQLANDFKVAQELCSRLIAPVKISKEQEIRLGDKLTIFVYSANGF